MEVLSETLKKIEESAKKRAEEIIAQAKEEAKKILKEANEEVEREKAERLAKEKESLEFELRQELQSAFSLARQKELQAKNEAILELKEEVLLRLSRMETEKKRALLGKMLRIAKRQIPEGFVYANAHEAEIVKGFGLYAFKGTIHCAGGIIVEEKSGERVIDLRYEILLEYVFKGRGEEIWKMLFE